MGRIGKQPQGQILPAHRGREAAAAGGSGKLESHGRRHRGNSGYQAGGSMTLWSRVRSWSKAIFQRTRMESEMDAEIRFHMEALAEDLMRGGMSPTEAQRRARIEFGGIERVKEEGREARATRLMDGLRGDIRFAVRNLRKHALLSATVIITLALGLGVSTAVFTFVDATALRARVDRDPDSFVRVYSTYTTDPANPGRPGGTTLE